LMVLALPCDLPFGGGLLIHKKDSTALS